MSQKLRLGRKHLCCAVITLATLASPLCYAKEKTPLPLKDPNAVIAKVLSALKKIEHAATGRGRATITAKIAETGYQERQVVVDFVFKGPNSRTDVFTREESGSLVRLYSDARSEKASIRVDRKGAAIQRREMHEVTVGYDFNPEIFCAPLGSSAVRHLEAILERPHVHRSVTHNEDGVLRFTSSGGGHTSTGKPRSVTRIWFDPAKGYRPVFWEKRSNRNNGTWTARSVKLEWTQYKGAWYVSHAKRRHLPDSKVHIAFTVERFKPNVEVSPKEFTLEGLGVPKGLRVHDAIAGIHYPYGDKASARPIIRRSKPKTK